MPKIEPSEIILEARRWVGTPYRDRFCRKGVGVDCVGLIRGVAECTGAHVVSADDWRPFEKYSRTPNPTRMGQAMALFLIPSAIAPADMAPDAAVCWLQWREGLPMHVGFVATFEGRRTLIHALKPVGKCVEHDFSQEWRSRVNSWWLVPGVAYP